MRQMQITTIGLDIAKNVFQVHGIDAAEKIVVRKQLRRKQMMPFFEGLAPCLVGMEACLVVILMVGLIARRLAGLIMSGTGLGMVGDIVVGLRPGLTFFSRYQ